MCYTVGIPRTVPSAFEYDPGAGGGLATVLIVF